MSYSVAGVNGVRLEPVTSVRAGKIELRVNTHGRARFSPTTSSVDPGLLCNP